MLFLAVFLFAHYPRSLMATGGWVVVGSWVYYSYARAREAAHVERTEWMERIERKQYRVLVAVSAPRTLETLMQIGIAVAKRHAGELVVLSVAEVPEGESLLAGRRTVRELEPLLEEAVAYAAQRDVPARPVIKIARRVSHGIIETALEEECNFIVIGQPYRQSFFERIVSTVVGRVFQNAPCQVAIVYGRLPKDGPRGVVLPTTKGANVELAAELAPAFGEWFGIPVRALTVVPTDVPKAEADTFLAEARSTLEAAGFPVDLDVVRRRDVVQGLEKSLRARDLVVMGAPSTAPVATLFGDTVPAALARHGQHPVIVVRDVEQQRAHRFERLFFRKG
jgi:nucleotide-binding universal stress UspA family protein